LHISDAKPLRKPASRDIKPKTRLFLFVRAAGRCEFDGCNRNLLEHYPTFTPGIFGQMAHIWAFTADGPRGHEGVDPTELNHVSNLILLCPACHKLVDQEPGRYSVSVLREFKRAHEDRVHMLAETKPDRATVALRLVANIGDHAVEISHAEMQEAAAPRYFNPREVVDIDLTTITDRASDAYWSVASGEIEAKLIGLHSRSHEHGPVSHVSVFALAPIPLLVFLGNQLSNKVATSFFQRHRDTQSWKWKSGPQTAQFSWARLRQGTDAKSVAVMYSLSGRIHESDLPASIDERFSVYELALSSEAPNPWFLSTEGDLGAFRAAHNDAVRALIADHEGLERLHVFPAVPAPVAVAMGWELLPKRDPSLLIFDFNKKQGGFQPTLEVNRT
jgi:hypothetical protein